MEIREVKLANVTADNIVRRKNDWNKDEIQSLAANIKAEGLLNIPIAEDVGNGKVRIIDGHGRFHAAKLLKWESMPFQVLSEKQSKTDRLSKGLSANVFRKEQPRSEIMSVLTSLKEGGKTVKQIREITGLSPASIKLFTQVANSLKKSGVFKPSEIDTLLDFADWRSLREIARNPKLAKELKSEKGLDNALKQATKDRKAGKTESGKAGKKSGKRSKAGTEVAKAASRVASKAQSEKSDSGKSDTAILKKVQAHCRSELGKYKSMVDKAADKKELFRANVALAVVIGFAEKLGIDDNRS